MRRCLHHVITLIIGWLDFDEIGWCLHHVYHVLLDFCFLFVHLVLRLFLFRCKDQGDFSGVIVHRLSQRSLRSFYLIYRSSNFASVCTKKAVSNLLKVKIITPRSLRSVRPRPKANMGNKGTIVPAHEKTGYIVASTSNNFNTGTCVIQDSFSIAMFSTSDSLILPISDE